MNRLLLFAALSYLVACKPSGITTIEEGESYAKEHGVVLTEKKEVTGVVVASRVYEYKANNAVDLHILQFNSEKAGAEWKRILDESPLAPETRIQKGSVVLMVTTSGTDVERQKVIDALK